ncbi:MAG: 3-hydroxyacyl-CoA dehydrogenase NAD-binding domain-containing protein [candidate division KSB1 bacterium]|nr:3-hydroxyacyl-CoA dehydrogenase NAD-binding domain-containing protein [candidate division KSB1 bacterium]MDZ7301519.1 3-hydroxyacyl-CoA dehydrogenase NAD-binding domain-containing protein [candidate division KSB1 bacterium]MDZ7311065.1 3-hydroxyacyl-CoA dehydrogenase NAD-binding domain-containing protein [candidate division KSB1 bacterium]
MTKKIEKVAVLGTGVMGSQLCAHLANVGIASLAFDISQELAEKGIQSALALKPSPFYDSSRANLITPCNYDQHLERLAEVDWVIEAVAERLDIKRSLFARIAPVLKSEAILSSNTSGLSIKEMMAEMPMDLRQRFLVTHFFNPPRYMRLIELIKGEETRSEVVDFIAAFCENVLGKGVVYAKDTPNFIANRIGVFGMMLTLRLAREMNLTVEEVDQLTGEIIGRPKSATFRTADVVGLDTLVHVAKTSYDKGADDEARDIFAIPDYLQKMLENKWLGQKTQKGFYQKVGKDILSLNLTTLEYGPQKPVRFDGYRVAKGYTAVGDKIKALVESDDRAGKFLWEQISQTLIYAANRIPEIADDIVNVDNAMKWGFGWQLGPFEVWDAIGVEKSARRMEKEGKPVPAWVRAMLDSGRTKFYETTREGRTYFDLAAKKAQPMPEKAKTISLDLRKMQGREIRRNWSASLIDLGDGVACVEFHSPLQPALNPIDAAMIDMLFTAQEVVVKEGFRGLVIGHQGQNFSAGANLALILELIKAKNWKGIEAISKAFQDVTQNLKHGPFPVVAAPFNLTLGGGYEVCAGADKIVASAELYCGSVEVGVGLIPGAGADLRLLLNAMKAMEKKRPGPFPPVQQAFETIAFAKVSTSAHEAIKLGYLTKDDRIVVNPEHLLHEAKQAVLELAKDYQPPAYRDDIYLPGLGGRLAIENTMDGILKSGKISAHDLLIGKKLAYVLTGGEKASLTKPVDEQYILDLEREAFVSLCGEKLTQDRIAHMLKTGKALRN